MAELKYTIDISLEVYLVITLTLPVHIDTYLLLVMYTTSYLPFNTTCYSLYRLDAFQFFLQIDARFRLNFLCCCFDDRCRLFPANKCNTVFWEIWDVHLSLYSIRYNQLAYKRFLEFAYTKPLDNSTRAILPKLKVNITLNVHNENNFKRTWEFASLVDEMNFGLYSAKAKLGNFAKSFKTSLY